MAVLANITGAAAELLLEAYLMTPRFGVELGGMFDLGTARELENEDFGEVREECETHGFGNRTYADCECPASETHQVFIINEPGRRGWRTRARSDGTAARDGRRWVRLPPRARSKLT